MLLSLAQSHLSICFKHLKPHVRKYSSLRHAARLWVCFNCGQTSSALELLQLEMSHFGKFPLRRLKKTPKQLVFPDFKHQGHQDLPPPLESTASGHFCGKNHHERKLSSAGLVLTMENVQFTPLHCLNSWQVMPLRREGCIISKPKTSLL